MYDPPPDTDNEDVYPPALWAWLTSLGEDPLEVALSNYSTLTILGDYDLSGVFDALAGGTTLVIDDGTVESTIDLSGVASGAALLAAINTQLTSDGSSVSASLNSDGLLTLAYTDPASGSTIAISGSGADILGLPTGTFGTTDMETTKMVEIHGDDLDELRFSSDLAGTPLATYDLDNAPTGTDLTDYLNDYGVLSGIQDLDGNDIYLFELEGDSNIVVGIDETGELSLAVYLDQTEQPVAPATLTDLQARIWTVQFEPLKHPLPGETDEAISLDDKLFLTSTDNLTFDASNSPSGQNLFIMFSKGDGTTDVSIVATGKEPINQSHDPSSITSGDTVNTSQAGGPTTFGINNQMLTSSTTPGEGDGIVFTYVANSITDYTVPNLDQNEADVEANIQFSGGAFSADTASFDVVQLQGGKTAVVKITAIDSTHITSGATYIDGQMYDIDGLALPDSDPDYVDPVDITEITVTGTRGKNNAPVNVTFAVDVGDVTIGTAYEVSDGAYSIFVTFYADGSVKIDGAKAGDNIEFTTDGDHNRVLIENAGSGSGQASANFDIGDFTLLDIASETVEIGDRIFWEDDGPGVASTSVAPVEEEHNTNLYGGDLAGGNDDFDKPVDDIDVDGNLDLLTDRSVIDYKAILFGDAGTDQLADFWLDETGLIEDNTAYDSISGVLHEGLAPGLNIPNGTYTIDDGNNVFSFTADGDDTLQDLIDAINSDPNAVATANIVVDGRLVIESPDADDLTLTGFEGVIFQPAPTLYSKGALVNFDLVTAGTDPVVYTLTGSVISIVGTDNTLEPTDTLDSVTYRIDNSSTYFEFTAPADGTELQDLIDAFNADGTVATVALENGKLVIESVNGDDLTLTNFFNIDAALVDDTYDDTRDVLTWVLEDDGTSTFTVLDQIDHETLNGVFGDNTENTELVNLQSYLHATDGDGDPFALGELGKYDVIDDIPIETDSSEVATVEEEHGLAGGNEDATGGFGSYLDDDTLVGPDYDQTKNTATGSLQSLVSVGTDEVLGGGATFSFAFADDAALDAFIVTLGLASQGENVTQADISGNTLTAKTADGDAIFSLTVEDNGDYTFTLIRTLDHDPSADGGDDTENLETIDLTGLIKAEDFDGDEIVLGTSGEDSSSFLVKVIDDIPVESGSLVTGTVEEEHGLTGGNEDAAGGTVKTVVIDSDLANDNAALDGDFVLTAGVYSVATTSGITTFTAPGDGTDLQDLIDKINGDGWATADIIGGDLIITSPEAVTLTGFSGVGLGDFVDGTPYVEGIDEDTEGSDDYTVTTNAVSGNLQSLVSIGSDQVASDGGASFDFAFADDAALDAFIVTLGLSSQGEDVTQADISGNTLTAKTADGDAIFSLALADNGDYTFTLLRNLDNPDPGSGATEDVLTIDLSGLVKVEDYDGDELVLSSGGFLIYAIDDVPILEVGNIKGTGTVDPQIGEWAGLIGADGYGSLAVKIDSITYGPSGDLTIDGTDIPLGDPTVGLDGELIFSGSISGDFDGNAVNGDETLNFSLTFNLDGTYVFDLEERFASSTTFSSDDGQLPAGGPDSVQTLIVGDEDILFFALDPLAYANDAEDPGTGGDYILDALAYEQNEPGLEGSGLGIIGPSWLMNVSTSGIGVDNNVLQGDNDPNRTVGDESYIVNTETDLTSVKIFIDNSVAGYDPTSEGLYYRVFFVGGGYSDYMFVDATKLSQEAGGQVSFTIEYDDPLLLGGGALIDAVQLTMYKGKIKIPTIEFTQETAVALDPITIDFDATLTDYDGDSVTDDFAVEIGTDGDPLVPPDITFDGTTDADVFNIDLASGFTTWVINGFDSTDGVEIDGDKIVLLNPLYDYNLVTGPDNDTITINGTTVTITNGADVLTSADILVAYADVVIDGDILVGDTLNQNVTGTADADALIVKEDLNTVTGGDGGDVFVFFDPDFSVNSVADFDSSEGDFLVISASGFGIDITDGPLSSGNFVSGVGATAGDADDYFLFDTSDNTLWFDADGNTPGGDAAVQIADFGTATLTAGDIFIIA